MRSYVLEHRNYYVPDTSLFSDLVALYEKTGQDIREENERIQAQQGAF